MFSFSYLFPVVSKQKKNPPEMRLNDFLNEKKKDVSLQKEYKFASEITTPPYPGLHSNFYKETAGLGSRVKEDKTIKKYYLSPHPNSAYFAIEIMLRAGIYTPKTRIVVIDQQKLLASTPIENYQPIPVLKNKLDIKKQVIRESKSEECRISGNLFGSFVAAALIGDGDFLGNNLGLRKVGRRYYAVAIDKEEADFSGLPFRNLLCRLQSGNKGKSTEEECVDDYQEEWSLFQYTLPEQIIAVVWQINKALTEGDFEKIFYNSRVDKTSFLISNRKYYFDNFMKTAISVHKYYKKIYGDDFINQYELREDIRNKIATQVLDNLVFSGKENAEGVRQVIVEDLRGPYYASFFYKNGTVKDSALLVETLVKDFGEEFELGVRNKVESSVYYSKSPG